VVGDVFHRLQAAGVKAPQQLRGGALELLELIGVAGFGDCRVPGDIGIFERDLTVEAGATGVPRALARGRIVERAPKVEKAGAEDVAVAGAGVPVEPEKSGDRL